MGRWVYCGLKCSLNLCLVGLWRSSLKKSLLRHEGIKRVLGGAVRTNLALQSSLIIMSFLFQEVKDRVQISNGNSFSLWREPGLLTHSPSPKRKVPGWSRHQQKFSSDTYSLNLPIPATYTITQGLVCYLKWTDSPGNVFLLLFLAEYHSSVYSINVHDSRQIKKIMHNNHWW